MMAMLLVVWLLVNEGCFFNEDLSVRDNMELIRTVSVSRMRCDKKNTRL